MQAEVHRSPRQCLAWPQFPEATQLPFASFAGRYTGASCYIVGRGPTTFDYAKLGRVKEPLFFINDAVCLEKYARSESYFFAHDAQMLVWLNGRIKSTAVIPVDGKVFAQTPGITLHHRAGLVLYRWCEAPQEQLLQMNRQELAHANQLFTHTGTIHSLLHFVWFCGFTRVFLIGCDCLNANQLQEHTLKSADGYDPRLINLSRSESSCNYDQIDRAQRLLIELFGLEAIYLGTPKLLID